MLYLALLLSVLAQVAAALIALRQVGKAGRYGLAWGCISLALVLMVQRRVQSLMEYSDSQPPDTEFTLVGLAISLLMLGGLWGLRLLFAELRRQEAALQTLAATDELTGLANRRSMVQRIQHELERGERNPRPTTLLMLDLDHFKGVNDTYGHAAGDAVLRALADLCRSLLRRIDTAGRWGGEEFMVLLPETDGDEALAAAERLRQQLAELAIRVDGQALNVTMSVGVATSGPGTTLDEAVARADQALYEAKNTGRNRVVVWH